MAVTALGFFSVITAAGEEGAQKNKVTFSCDGGDLACWSIPDWAKGNPDYVGLSCVMTDKMANNSCKSLDIECDFSGSRWAAAIVECEKNIDISSYKTISADIYSPESIPSDFMQARFVITAGDWYFFENVKAFGLTKGKWTRVTAMLDKGSAGDDALWRCPNSKGKKLSDYITDVKKIGIRVEYNAGPKNAGPAYKGPIYIDNIEIE
ncbi:MAG: hypothetical protein HQL28_07205 [Candidatus Omnitrophica bacterium]|nr:hypothetical protein [Candidatus Omnitrophota bacterium]